MIDVTNYKQFMGIDSFPVFDVKYYTLDLTGDYSYGARAEYDVKTKAHTLMLPRNCGASKFLLFHELTHNYGIKEGCFSGSSHLFWTEYCPFS